MTARKNWGRIKGCIACALLMLGLVSGNMLWAAEKGFEQGLDALRNGQYQRAVEAFTLAIASAPQDFEAYNNRGFARIYTGDYDGAIADCSQAIRHNPGSAKAYNNRGFAYIFKEAYEEARSDFDRAIAINPRYVDAYSNRCLAEIRLERYARAAADCSQALAINPRSSKALYNRGFARDRQGDHAGALDDYIQALKVNPGYIEVFNNIAWILATSQDERLRDGQRAVVLAEKALAHASDVNSLDTLAAAYAEAGRYDEAVAAENRVVTILAARGPSSVLKPHVERLSLYEEGRPYRDPVKVQAVSAVTDLSQKFADLDRLMQTRGDQARADQSSEMAQATVRAPKMAQAAAVAQAPPEPSTPEIRVTDQTVLTASGEPVEIMLSAVSDNNLPMTFEIATVPFQGALHGTLPRLTYTPRNGFTGTDRFTFRAVNAAGRSRLASVVINVVPKAGPTVTASAPPAASASGTREAGDATAKPSIKTRAPAEAEEDRMPTPAVRLPAEPMPGTAAVKPAGSESRLGRAEKSAAAIPKAEASSREFAPAGGLSRDLRAGSLYAIQVRSVKEPAIAEQEIAQLRRDGFPAFIQTVEIPGKGTWHRVFIKRYPAMEAARQDLSSLDKTRFKDAYIRRIPVDGRPPAAAAATPEPPAADALVASSAVPATGGPTVSSENPARYENPRATFPYAFQIKSYRDRNEAYQLGVELTSQGRRAFIGVSRLGTTGEGYRVYVGGFRTPEEGENLRSDLIAEGFEDAILSMIPYAIEVRPRDYDPSGEDLENQLLAKSYLPYRLPEKTSGGRSDVLVGGFRDAEEARSTLEALLNLGYEARVILR